MDITIIGAPFNGDGTPLEVDNSAKALRRAGLVSLPREMAYIMKKTPRRAVTRPHSKWMVTVFAFLLALCSTAGAFSEVDSLSGKIRERIEGLRATGDLKIGNAAVASLDMLPGIYERNDFEPLWQDPKNVEDLVVDIGSIEEDGLNPEDYHLSDILVSRLRLDQDGGGDANLLADLDLLLTDSLIRLCYHLNFGKVDPEGMHPNWNMGRQVNADRDPVGALLRRLRTATLSKGLENIRPRYDRYRLLKTALRQYRAMQEAGGWRPVPDGPTLKPGMIDPRVVDLRRRLAASGDYGSRLSLSTYYDEGLVAAVKRFQRRHHLEEDGKVGSHTLASLNVPVKKKIDQIRVNLERARWVLHKLPPEYLWVDIAGFEVLYFSNGAVRWSSRIMVGKPYRHTPVFKSKIEYIVFNPTWTVPPTILKEDILPKLKQGPDYLYEKKIEVIDRDGSRVDPATVDWSRYSTGIPFTFRQAPGPHNALGRMKFILPNRYYIFMHDTPSRSLFEKQERAISSGCIRVEKYFELAQILLGDHADWTAEKIREVIDSEETQRVNLARKMPVILMYSTVSVAENGEVFFKKDVYGRDRPLLDALNEDYEIWQRKAFL